MLKKNFILTLLVLFAFIFAYYLSVSPVNRTVKIDDGQDERNINALSRPKSSGHTVAELWNDTMAANVTCVAVSADGKYMAVATDKGAGDNLFFYNTTDPNGTPLWSHPADLNYSSLAISANGSYIIGGSKQDMTMGLFNITGDLVWYVDLSGGGPLNSVDISADGEFIVMGVWMTGGGGYGVVAVFDNSYPLGGPGDDKSNEMEWYYMTKMDLAYVNSVAISADGKYVVAGTDYNSVDDVIFFWNNTDYTQGSEQPPMWRVDAQESISSVAISADGSSIVAGSSTGYGYLFSSDKPNPGQEKSPLWYIDYSPEEILSTDISADGKYAVFGRDSGSIDVYDDSFEYINEDKTEDYLWLYEAEGEVNSVVISANGDSIVAGTEYNPNTGAANENTIFLFDSVPFKVGAGGILKNDLESVNNPEWFFNTSYDVNSVSISADGSYIAAGGLYDPFIDFGISFLFYHETTPSPWIEGNADIDDEDTGFIVIVIAIMAIASIGIEVIVLVVLIKKSIASKPKR
jgi:hypothetical protein